MKERPILMSAPMVRALLAGTKTQTRRIMKPQPTPAKDAIMHRMVMPLYNTDWVWHRAPGCSTISNSPTGPDSWARDMSPYGQPGDRLWVRETFCELVDYDPPHVTRVYYAATESEDIHLYDGDGFQSWNKDGSEKSPWKPSIHMPRRLSRLTLEITDVRVQRLQDISEEEAGAEGIRWTEAGPLHAHIGLSHVSGAECNFPTAVAAYRALWNDINGEGSWDASPWVWALTFKRVAQ